MRRILFFLTMALMSVCVMAQEKLPYDEELLEGDWEAFSESAYLTPGSNLVITKIQLRTAGQCGITVWDMNRQLHFPHNFSHYFISNNNKLHIVGSDNPAETQYFVIRDFYIREEDGSPILVLARYNGSIHQNYNFRKTTQINAIRSSEREINEESKKYGVSGVIKGVPDGLYIQNGKKYIAK